MKYRDEVIELICKAIEEDEYTDSEQADNLYQDVIPHFTFLKDFVERNLKSGKVLEIGCGSGRLFDIFPITHAIEPNPLRYKHAIRRAKERVVVKMGWIEAIPFHSNYFDTVLCLGAFCFIRSEDEALVEVNRVLKKNGVFIFDVVEETTLPIAKTTNAKCFVKRLNLFGFDLIEFRRYYSEIEQSKKVYLAVEKVRDFDYRYLKLPQLVGGEIKNYLRERDWYLL